MPSDDLKPACDVHLLQDEFDQANGHHIASLGPCKYCFPEGEITAEREDLLVVKDGVSERSVHRHERTGALDYESPSRGGTKLATILKDEEKTSWDDLAGDDEFQRALGGGA